MLATPLFAALLAIIFVVLSLYVIKHRFAKQVSIGDGDHHELSVAIRLHANFIEYVPLALLLMWFIETVIFDSKFAFGLGVVLLVGRLMHIAGMLRPRSLMILRQIGMVSTLLVLLSAAVRILWHYLPF